MLSTDRQNDTTLPLAGCRVIERSRTVAAAYAGRLLAAMGAQVVMLEPTTGSPLRRAAPILEDTGESALFAFLAAGKHSLICDLSTAEGRDLMARELADADILLDDTPLRERAAQGLASEDTAARYPKLVHVSVLPYGATGPKAHWDAEEVNLVHAGGEGFLLPNGLSCEQFPDRPPLKVYGNFASYQGGCAAAWCALSAWWAVPMTGGQYVDVSVQDANLAVGAFALQRLGDGSLEHRTTRSFRYGGVFEAKDGYVEVLTLEDRQWQALVQLLGEPAWALDETLQDPLERSRRGTELNAHIRAWMREHAVEDIVSRAQALGVPAAKYRTPAEVLNGEQETARSLFAKTTLESGRRVDLLTAPFQFRCSPLPGGGRVPALGELSEEAVQ
ncbi:CoA transferase (plasmid) [Cupriavidus pinatubonensis]|uniref:CoA transferase n=1 Tax=Cupriavidus pinatubonensis TaxID=248026 RepID=UPI001C730BF7|nr:CoA transferase [Cupriavidus pinatubonensis]QYY33829.1 CoA transferase [Cupriavidus pinatubonensis]